MTRRRIDRDSSIPYYEQLAEIIIEAIDEGRWRPGDLIPSEAELTSTYRISRTVIRSALALLSNHGRIRRIKGKGTRVLEPILWDGSPELSGPYAALVASYRLVAVVECRLIAGAHASRGKLGIEDSVPILHVVVISERSDRPGVAATLSSFDIACDASPALARLTQEGKTPQFRLGGPPVPAQLATQHGLQLSDSPTTLSIGRRTASEAALLKVSRAATTFCYDWVTYDVSGRIVITGRSISADNPRLRFVVHHKASGAPATSSTARS
jgi:DNA-binding GntR family transcriptional regulator